MLVVSWNMGCARRSSKYRRTHDAAWRYLLDYLRPDIALIQEAALDAPAWVAAEGTLLQRPAYDGQDWGSGVFVRDSPASEVVIRLDGSYVVAAEIAASSGSFLAASIHVCPAKQQKKYLRDLIDDLVPRLQGVDFVVGGDLNAARRYDEVYKRNAYKWFFAELASAGFHDCHWSLHRREVQSFWGRKTVVDYQDDHLFVSAGWSAKVAACDVIDNERVRELSDHGPIRLLIAE